MNKEEIINDVLSLGSDDLPTFGGSYEGGINLQQSPSEISDLILYLLNDDREYKNFIEVGSAAGGNIHLLNKYFGFDNITIVDDNNHHKHHLRPANLAGIKYTEYIGNSQSVEAHNFVRDLNIKYDVMIIDADHSYEGVKNDTYNFVEFLNNGGILIFHDTVAVYDINRWFSEMKNNYDFEFIAEFKSDISRQLGIGVFRKK